MRDKFKYLSDRQLAKKNIDPFGTVELTNRFVSDMQTDSLNKGYKRGAIDTVIGLGLLGMVLYLADKVTKRNKKDVINSEEKED